MSDILLENTILYWKNKEPGPQVISLPLCIRFKPGKNKHPYGKKTTHDWQTHQIHLILILINVAFLLPAKPWLMESGIS